MFRCNSCKEVANKMFKLVTEKKERQYYNVVILDEFGTKQIVHFQEENKEVLDNLKSEGKKVLADFTTKGWEIVNEIGLCQKCFVDQGGII